MAKVSIDEEYLDVLEATRERAKAMEAAVKNLVFWAGELPAKDTTVHKEFRVAYTVAANFFRDSSLVAETNTANSSGTLTGCARDAKRADETNGGQS